MMAASATIRSLADLKGKKIAIWSVPSDATLALETLVKKQGMNAGTDFRMCAYRHKTFATPSSVSKPTRGSCSSLTHRPV